MYIEEKVEGTALRGVLQETKAMCAFHWRSENSGRSTNIIMAEDFPWYVVVFELCYSELI